MPSCCNTHVVVPGPPRWQALRSDLIAGVSCWLPIIDVADPLVLSLYPLMLIMLIYCLWSGTAVNYVNINIECDHRLALTIPAIYSCTMYRRYSTAVPVGSFLVLGRRTARSVAGRGYFEISLKLRRKEGKHCS